MSDWPVGLSTGSFYQISIFDCLEAIRAAGFGMIEICSSPIHLNYHDLDTVRHAADWMKELDLEAYSFHAPFIDVDISSPNPIERECSLKEIIHAAEAAAILEVRHFVIHPGPDKVYYISIQERMQRLRNTAEMLDIVAERCQELGVGLVLENMLPHLAIGGISDMLWIIGAMTNVNISTCLDTGHAALSGNIYNVLYKLGGNLQIIHINDNHGTGDDHLPPGAGNLDWSQILFELHEIGFYGGLILELASAPDNSIEQLLGSARHARWYLRRLARNLYLSSPPSVQ